MKYQLRSILIHSLVLCCSLVLGASTLFGAAAPAPVQTVNIQTSPATGLATFVTPTNGNAIPVTPKAGVANILPTDFLEQYGHLFGIKDHQTELAVAKAGVDSIGYTTTTYEQYHNGVRVFSGVVKVHQNVNGGVSSANGDFYPISDKLNTVADLSADEAASIAADVIEHGNPWIERAELVIVDPGWYGDPSIGAHLAYYLILADTNAPLREAFFVDAHNGRILDQWSLIHTAKNRAIYDGQNAAGLPGVLVRGEGAPAVGLVDANRAYDYYGDTYDYFFRAHNRDSIDDAGLTMIATVNSTFVNPPCPNAFWNGVQMAFCDNTVTDDVVGHELSHGVTQYTADLVYQNQSGQINEGYSDVFGELIDLFNGNAAFAGTPGGTPWPTHATGPGVDTPNNLRTSSCSTAPGYADGMRWLIGEDATAFGGSIRDMWNPPCEGHPDRNNSSLQTCPGNDAGGVHSGSGILNHAFAMVTDGKTFNGHTAIGIGPIKSGAIWYRALTTYLTPSSDYQDAYLALTQAAQDLVGTTPNDPRTGLASASSITASDVVQVTEACLAVEMNTDGACGATVSVLDPVPPTQCDPQSVLYSDNFESGANGWTVSNTNPPTPYNWVQTTGLPAPMTGTAWFCDDPDFGDCNGQDESGVHSLVSPVINLPANLSRPTIAFTHYIATEANYDGGNISVRINGGAWQLVPASAFEYNEYNTSLNSGNNTNPMAGQAAWTGAGGGWGTTLLDLESYVSGGETFQIRFDFGKDGCTGNVGWYLADFKLYVCPCSNNSECDDGLFCNGVETCVSGACQSASATCNSPQICDEANNQCLTPVFQEAFESGNVQGWTLHSAGSTATAGAWIFGNPVGTTENGNQAQPETGLDGSLCAFTGQNPTGALGTDDVDGGVTWLMTPTINLAGQTSAQLLYYRWFYNRDVNEDANDFYRVEASSNNGSSWVTVENLGSSVNANSWTQGSVSLESFISLTATVRVRFGASDGAGGNGNLIEGALDDVVVATVVACVTPADCADGNPCTNDVCTTGVCSNPNNSVSCSDGLFCTTNDTCSGGVCVGGASGCPELCDETNNICVECLTAANCNDGVSCTQDTCESGACSNIANDALCNDGLFCNGTESCNVLSGCTSTGNPCSGGDFCDETMNACVECLTAAHCNDGVSCTVDTCVSGACSNVTNDSLCDDGLFCTGIETCNAGAGCSSSGNPCGNPLLCDEGTNHCICEAPEAEGVGSKYIAVTPAASSTPVAIRVVGHPGDNDVSCLNRFAQADGSLGDTPVYQLPAVWATTYIGDSEIIAMAQYFVLSDCGSVETPNFSTEVVVETGQYGELTGDAIINLDDILRMLGAFGGSYPMGTTLENYDIAPCVPDGSITLDDILAELSAFSGGQPSCPAVCP